MPLREYRCPAGHVHEDLQPQAISAPPSLQCPECDEPAHIQPALVQVRAIERYRFDGPKLQRAVNAELVKLERAGIDGDRLRSYAVH